MTITDRTATRRVPMDSTRKTALVAGVFYLITYVSIPTLGLYGPVKGKDFIISSAASTGAQLGCLLEVIVALAGIGTAVTLFPVLRRQNEGMALGFAARERCVAGHLAVPIGPRATCPSRGRTHRSPPAVHRRHPHDVRRHRPGLLRGLDPRHPDLPLGALARHLSGRQGLQALAHHGRNGRGRQPARIPRRRRLTVEDTAGPTTGPAAVRAGRPARTEQATSPGDPSAAPPIRASPTWEHTAESTEVGAEQFSHRWQTAPGMPAVAESAHIRAGVVSVWSVEVTKHPQSRHPWRASPEFRALPPPAGRTPRAGVGGSIPPRRTKRSGWSGAM